MTRVALVVGGNRGIGLAVARRFIADGYRVAVTYRQAPPPDGVFGVPCDVTNLDSVREAFDRVEEELGPVEVLVVNAGIARDGLLVSMSERDFAAPVLTNLTGAYRVTKRAVRGMLRARRGRIVLLSSQVALSGEAGQANYAAAKAGLIGFARSLARELGGRGITVNVVAPGLTDTDMAAALPEARRQAILAGVPMGRMVRPEEVAAAVAFLAGSDAGAITGAVVPVDGGAGMGH
uniref:SDR family oxidoreductase n=1 Tax=Streptomyces sp. NBC_00003 TaxID=2903608 RepID=A0AAU2V903_9ACTN